MKKTMMVAVVLAQLVLGEGPAGARVEGQQAAFTVDKEKKEILIPSKISPRKMAHLPEIYPIEVVATWPHPQGQKAHETVVNIDPKTKPSEVYKALEGLGLKAGKPARGEDGVPSGAEIEIFIELADKAGAKKRIPLESVLVDRRTAKPFPPLKWLFTGSSMKQADPSKPDMTFSADTAGTFIGIYPVTDELIVQTNLTMKEEGTVKIEIAKGSLPPEGTPVTLVIKPAGPRTAVPAAGLSGRASAEAEVLKITQRMAMTAARPAAMALAAPPPAPASIDPLQHRREVDGGRATPEEARPIALPLPQAPAK